MATARRTQVQRRCAGQQAAMLALARQSAEREMAANGLVVLSARYGPKDAGGGEPACVLVQYLPWPGQRQQQPAAAGEDEQKHAEPEPASSSNSNLSSSSNTSDSSEDQPSDRTLATATSLHARSLDVTVPVQFMVRESQLHLSAASQRRHTSLGFYSPASLQGVAAEDWLCVQYLHRGALHRVCVRDIDSLSLPDPAHAV